MDVFEEISTQQADDVFECESHYSSQTQLSDTQLAETQLAESIPFSLISREIYLRKRPSRLGMKRTKEVKNSDAMRDLLNVNENYMKNGCVDKDSHLLFDELNFDEKKGIFLDDRFGSLYEKTDIVKKFFIHSQDKEMAWNAAYTFYKKFAEMEFKEKLPDWKVEFLNRVQYMKKTTDEAEKYVSDDD